MPGPFGPFFAQVESKSAGRGKVEEPAAAPRPQRTAEEIREVVERLAQGCSARPRKSVRKRQEEKEESAAEELPVERRSSSSRYADVQACEGKES